MSGAKLLPQLQSGATAVAGGNAEFAADVRDGLGRAGQKQLLSKYLYDALGSALFEAITELPEYGLTRAGERLLQAHSAAIAARAGDAPIVAELGSGSGRKTRLILEAMTKRHPTLYFPIEISGTALAASQRELSDIDSVRIEGIEADYLHGLDRLAARRNGQPLLLLFLGSTIGNFEPPADLAFLTDVRSRLRSGDLLFLATDLRKPEPRMLAAYDDALGVTAAFNRNLLVRMNRELDADFALERFVHRARFNRATGSVEMHLESTEAQRVTIPAADLSVTFAAGETIHTETSHKFTHEEVDRLTGRSGFRGVEQWVDQEWLFAQTLLAAV